MDIEKRVEVLERCMAQLPALLNNIVAEAREVQKAGRNMKFAIGDAYVQISMLGTLIKEINTAHEKNEKKLDESLDKMETGVSKILSNVSDIGVTLTPLS
jgi:hypothetical protein